MKISITTVILLLEAQALVRRMLFLIYLAIYQGLDLCQDYCSSFHASLALNEGQPGIGTKIKDKK